MEHVRTQRYVIITFGHQPFPVWLENTAGLFLFPVDKKAEQKWCDSFSSIDIVDGSIIPVVLASVRNSRLQQQPVKSGRGSSIVTINPCCGCDMM